MEDGPLLENDPNTRGSWEDDDALQHEVQEAREALRDVSARLKALQNTVKVLEDDKEKLIGETLALLEENDKLKEEISNYNSSLPKHTIEAPPATQSPAPGQNLETSESKLRRSQSKKKRREDSDQVKCHVENKERENLHEEDKKRLKSRFDHKDTRDSGSVSSGSSGRKSYVEPYGPSMSRAYEESKSYRPRKSRSDSSYSQLRPKIIPITARSDYEGSIAAYDAGYAGEDGHYGYSSTIEGDEQYHAYPLRGSIIPGSQTKPLNSSEAPVTRSKIMPPIIESSKHQSRGKRDPTRTSNTQSATALANVCLNVFNTCCSRKSLEANHWIENRQADFNIWMAAMTDVRMAGLSSSFEFGLDVRPRELKLVKDLLVKLGSCLMECATIHGGDLLEESKRNVDSAIRNLTLLAIAIRHTRRKTRRFKLDDNSDPSALADLRKHLEYLILVDTTVFNDSTRQRHETQPLWWQDRSSDSLTPLQQRLIEANLRRRQRFLAAQQDSDQISRQHISSPIHAEETMSSITSVLDKVQSPSTNEKNIASPPAPGISTRPEFQPSLLITSPEASTSFTTGLCIDNESHDAETPQTQRSLIRTATDYPRLVMPRPQIEGDGHDNLHGTTVLKCPCCCETLPHSMLENEGLWKDHLAADVNPYTCIAKDCPRPHVLYRSVAQWKAHVRKQHHAKTWNCQLCDESDITTYTSPEQLSEHVREKHADSFPEQLLGTVSLWPCSISVGLDVCPLCSVTGQLDSPVLIRHILEHIHDFSLRSLPWADMPIEYEQGSTASGTYELSYLQQSEPADPRAPILPWRML